MNNSTIYVRLWSQHDLTGEWAFNDYTYTAFNDTKTKAVMSSPTNGSTLSGSSQVFTWTVNGTTNHYLYCGSSVGASDYFYGGTVGNSINATGLPTSGVTLYVRLWSVLDGEWVYNDYTYTSGP